LGSDRRRQDGVATAKEIHSLIFSCIAAAAAAAQKAAGGALHECANAISYYKLGLRVRWMMEFMSTFQNGIPLKKMHTHTHVRTYRERVLPVPFSITATKLMEMPT
jgi:hypothetical protein